MIDRNSPVPLYYQLAQILKSQIDERIILPAAKLPSESEMVRMYGVGRLTVREALSKLVNAGYLVKEHGKGTFCKGAPTKIEHLNIDVMLDTSDSYFFPFYISGINEVLITHNATFLIHDTRNDICVISSLLHKVLSRGTSGVILQPSTADEDIPEHLLQQLESYRSHHIPYIMIDNRYQGVDSSYVIIDELRGGFLATEHLISLGHTRLGGIFPDRIRDSIQRKTGFYNALDKHNIPLKSATVFENEEHLYAQRDLLLEKENRITGLVCYHDGIAIKVVRILKMLGLNVPQDVSVIGYDDSFRIESSEVPLTTISHPKDKMAIMAASKLIDLTRGQEKWPFTFTYQPELVVRGSTATL